MGRENLLRAGHDNAERVADSLAKPFYIESPGIGLKKYPSCYHARRALGSCALREVEAVLEQCGFTAPPIDPLTLMITPQKPSVRLRRNNGT